ncbi:MAG: hypothetical protein HQ523_02005 [Lentisphaerae bacterium]|nr:hypothetical protein [Lentisphaerota bacterium]
MSKSETHVGWRRAALFALILVIGLAGGASAAPGWAVCDVAWAGCGGNGVYIVLVNPTFSNTLGAIFPANSIMVSTPADTTMANRYLVTALSAVSSRRKVLVYVEPKSFSVIGGMYVVAAYASDL